MVDAVVAVAVQLAAKAAGLVRTTLGFAGIVPPFQFGKPIVIVPPEASAPVVLVVKFAVQFAKAPAASELALTETALTDGSMV